MLASWTTLAGRRDHAKPNCDWTCTKNLDGAQASIVDGSQKRPVQSTAFNCMVGGNCLRRENFSKVRERARPYVTNTRNYCATFVTIAPGQTRPPINGAASQAYAEL